MGQNDIGDLDEGHSGYPNNLVCHKAMLWSVLVSRIKGRAVVILVTMGSLSMSNGRSFFIKTSLGDVI